MSAAPRRLTFAHGLKALPRAVGVLWRAPRVLLGVNVALASALLATLLLLLLAWRRTARR